jgi:hypothetical protein
VFRDRMVSESDMAKFDEFRGSVTKKYFDDLAGGTAAVEAPPLLFTSFMQVRALVCLCVCVSSGEVLACRAVRAWACRIDTLPRSTRTRARTYTHTHMCTQQASADDTPLYAPVLSYDGLKKVLEDKLAEYNETNAVMDLVLFRQALEHVTRISRIIDQPRCALRVRACACVFWWVCVCGGGGRGGALTHGGEHASAIALTRPPALWPISPAVTHTRTHPCAAAHTPCTRGNAMLVGVGGSGKQSLARLAAYICGCDVFQIAVSSTYGVADFKVALLALYAKAGAKGQPVVFLMTDNQIVKEQFLVYINDLLSTGIVADLFSPEDKDGFCNAVRNEVKATGQLDTPENCWTFFINKVGRVGWGGVCVCVGGGCECWWGCGGAGENCGRPHAMRHDDLAQGFAAPFKQTQPHQLTPNRSGATSRWCCASAPWATSSASACASSQRSSTARSWTGSTAGPQTRC